MKIIETLKRSLEVSISNCKEAYIAVALINEYGYEILCKAKTSSKIKIVAGIDLPTSVDVLTKLKSRFHSSARIYQNEFFHPKVYLFRLKDDSLIAYLGSANFTNGGLENNIELSVSITNQTECHKLLSWFNEIFDQSQIITDNFLTNYKTYTDKWIQLGRKQKAEISNVKKKSQIFEESSISKEQKEEIKKDILTLRNNKKIYDAYCSGRTEVIKEIRDALDYHNNFRHIDVDGFLSIAPLGYIVPINKRSLIKAEKDGSLTKLFRMLCDDSIPIDQRLSNALSPQSTYHVKGCGKNIITKVLTIHNPKQYFVFNNVTQAYLDTVDLHFKRGTTFPQKYILLGQIFDDLCKENKIRDFAVLDEILYGIMREREQNTEKESR